MTSRPTANKPNRAFMFGTPENKIGKHRQTLLSQNVVFFAPSLPVNDANCFPFPKRKRTGVARKTGKKGER